MCNDDNTFLFVYVRCRSPEPTLFLYLEHFQCCRNDALRPYNYQDHSLSDYVTFMLVGSVSQSEARGAHISQVTSGATWATTRTKIQNIQTRRYNNRGPLTNCDRSKLRTLDFPPKWTKEISEVYETYAFVRNPSSHPPCRTCLICEWPYEHRRIFVDLDNARVSSDI